MRKSSSSFAPLVFFASEDNKHRSVSLKILSNFSKNPGAFYILSSADAIVSACELLVNSDMEKSLSESESRHCINIICMLSTDACNRSKIRRAGALRKLISIMSTSQSSSEIALVCLFYRCNILLAVYSCKVFAGFISIKQFSIRQYELGSDAQRWSHSSTGQGVTCLFDK